MKNNFFTLVALTGTLFTGNLFAQEDAALSNAQQDANATAYDCVKSVTSHDRTLGFQGAVVTQEFTACTDGALKFVSLTVKNATDNTPYLVQLMDNKGDIIDITRFTKSALNQESLVLDLNAPVKEGKNYALMISAPEGKPLALRYLESPMGTLSKNGEPVRGQLAGTFGFESRTLADVDAMNEGRGDAAPQNRGLDAQCKVGVNGNDGRVILNGEGNRITQSFTACSTGILEYLTVNVQSSFDDFMGRMFVKNAEGETLYEQNITARNITNGQLNLPLEVRVEQGEELTMGIKTLHGRRIALKRNSQERVGECNHSGMTLGVNLEFTAFIAEQNDAPARSEEADTKITTFPNPFADRITVRMENAPDGKAVVQLLDFAGNVLRSDIVDLKNAEGEITFNTRDIDRPGFYALRVVQGSNVQNMTIMKR